MSLLPRVYILFARGENAEDFVNEAHTRINKIVSYVQESYVPVPLRAFLFEEGTPEYEQCVKLLDSQVCAGYALASSPLQIPSTGADFW